MMLFLDHLTSLSNLRTNTKKKDLSINIKNEAIPRSPYQFV